MHTAHRSREQRHSLLLHFIGIFLLSTSVLITALGLYTYQRFKLQQEQSQRTETLRLDLAAKIVSRNLQQLIIDLRLLTESQYVQDFLDQATPDNSAKLEKDFINLAKQTAIYDQIRFIDHKGRERIRVNYNNGAPRAIATTQLQDKSDRYYFRDSILLPAGHIYLSPLDLNVENGTIEAPYKPVIRVAAPLFESGRQQSAGILVLNYLAARLLNRFEEVMTESWGNAMILNQEGYWLYSPQREDAWGFMFGNHNNFARRYPLAWEILRNSTRGTVRTREGLFTYTTLHPNVLAGLPVTNLQSDSMVWHLISHVEPQRLSYSLWQTARDNANASVLLLLATSLLSFLLASLWVTNRNKTKMLSISRARYHNLFDNMAEGYALQEALFDSNGKVYDFRYMNINPAFERILGLNREQVIGKTIKTLFPNTEQYWIDTYARVATTCQASRLEQYSGSVNKYFEITAASPEYGLVAVFFADVSERKRAEEKQRQAATAFNNTIEAIMITDADFKIIAVNQAYSNITGYTAEEAMNRTPNLHQSSEHDAMFYQKLREKLEQTGHWQGEIWNQRKNGELFPAWENISVVRDEQGRISNYVSVFSDISSIKQTEARLSELAHHDTLTGLANRLAFNLNLEKALQRARRHQHKLALLFLDLDRFKLINDTLGHAAGDKMLQIVAERLKRGVRAEDLVARLGGDEFTIVLEAIGNSEDAANLAQKIIQIVSEPMQLNDQEVVTSTSIGLSIFPEDADTAADLARAADSAMYRAKARGRNTFEFYTHELTSHAIQRLSIESNLRQALLRDELQLYYQPQLNISTGELCGVEALLRWQHPELGLLLPETFIHVAEESPLIDSIGEWVLHKVCAQARAWLDAGLPRLRIALNLSPRQIMYNNIVAIMRHALEANRLGPKDVGFELEITESVLQSEELIIQQLRQLRQFGVSIAIDDFGTGYSSLSHLKQLPIDTLKIDRAFLRNIPDDSNNNAITAAIVSMGHSLGMRVVAEGIETPAQLQFLEHQGCDEAQGFLFSSPLEPAQCAEFLQQGRVYCYPPS